MSVSRSINPSLRTGGLGDRTSLKRLRRGKICRSFLVYVVLLWTSTIGMVAASTRRTGNTFSASFPRRSLMVRRRSNELYGYRSQQQPLVGRHVSLVRYSNRRMLAAVPTTKTVAPQRSDFYADLNVFGKTVAGCVEILTSVAFDYCMGYASGYFLGTVLGVPRAIFFADKTASSGVGGDIWKIFMERTKQVHSKSHSYGRSWGNVSAVFGGSRTAISVVRGSNKNDDWNEIFSSVLAGALMSRSGGPKAMLRSAAIYGGLMYMLSSGSKRMTPFTTYEEQLVEF